MYSSQALKEELSETLIDCGDSYNECDNIFTANLNKHTPEKNRLGVVIKPIKIRSYVTLL